MKRIFLAAPFKSLMNQETNLMYENEKNQISMLIELLEKKGYSVHNAHKREAWGKAFMTPDECTEIDYQEIKKCDLFVAMPGIPSSPGTHIEIGWASAWNKKIILLIHHNIEDYAYLIRGLHRIADVSYIVYQSDEECRAELSSYL